LKPNIIAIVGSLRQHSLNRALAEKAAQILDAEAAFEILSYDDIPFFNADIEYPAPAAVQRVREIVDSADGIWFFAPEYNHFFPAVLKNLIDWLSRPISETRPQVLAGKTAALSGISPGMSGTGIAQDHLVTLLSFLDMRIMNKPRLTVPGSSWETDAEGTLILSPAAATFLEEQARAFVKFVNYPLRHPAMF